MVEPCQHIKNDQEDQANLLHPGLTARRTESYVKSA